MIISTFIVDTSIWKKARNSTTDKFHFLRLHAFWKQTWDPERKASTWLEEAVAAHQEKSRLRKEVNYFSSVVNNEVVRLTIDMAKDDQMAVALLVLKNLKHWVQCATTKDPEIAETYKPLRLTVRGSAGSGKSFFIKALANTIRDMFGDQEVVQISAPTGAAAHNVGGETIHRKFAINPHVKIKTLFNNVRDHR